MGKMWHFCNLWEEGEGEIKRKYVICGEITDKYREKIKKKSSHNIILKN